MICQRRKTASKNISRWTFRRSYTEFRKFRLMIYLSVVSSFTMFIYSGILYSCGLSLFQNAIVPYVCVSLLANYYRPKLNRAWLVTGLVVASGVGAFGALIYLIASQLHYRYFGGEAAAAVITGIPISPNPSVLNVAWQLASQLSIWVLLTLLSAVSGLIAAKLSAKPLETDLSQTNGKPRRRTK